MTNKAQTMLTIALTAAVSALLVDRIIEPAQAQDSASSTYVLIGYRNNAHGSSMFAHDFDSKETCEAAKGWKEWHKGITACFPK